MLEHNEPYDETEPSSGNPSTNAGVSAATPTSAAGGAPRRRRRAASRPAGPPKASPETNEPGAGVAAGEVPAGAAGAEAAVPAVASQAGVAAGVDEITEDQPEDALSGVGGSGEDVSGAGVAVEGAGEVPAGGAGAEAAVPAAASQAGAAAGVDETVEDESGAALSEVGHPGEDVSGAGEAVEVPAAGGAGAEAAVPAVASPAGGANEGGEADRPQRLTMVAPAVIFQAPVFAMPVFETGPEAPTYEEPADDDAEQADAAATRRRRRRRRAARSLTPSGDPVQEGGDSDEPAEAAFEGGSDGKEGPEAGDDSGDDDTDRAEYDEESGERRPRRRRRGGRRRRRGDLGADQDLEAENDEVSGDGETADEALPGQDEFTDEGGAADADDETSEASGGSRRRRRRRRRSGDEATAESEPAPDDPERTVVKIREPRKKAEADAASAAGAASDEVQSIKGSTRLEAKKQRRREGREQGRRRVPIITEAEFLARREAVERVMVVRETATSGGRTQIGVLEDGILVEHFVSKEESSSYVGNVYLGKVQNVLPSMEAAFVDIGKGRNAVLYAGEVNFDSLGMHGQPRRIEAALKSGQSVLVQVTKDPIGHKGARLTSQISLPGRYLVYVPEGSMTGISRKLPDTERARLKQVLKKIVPDNAGVIVRTAAEGASEDELARDVARLQAQWDDIKKKTSNGNAPTLLYGEPDLTVRVVRDIFNEDFKKVIVSGDDAWETIHGYVSHVAPDLTDRLQKWTSDVDAFATYRIDEQLTKGLDRKVWLPSGGSLVIDRTEAMVVIDVNTGKFTGQGGNLEETVTRNNLEAAEEIVRQLRLRDLGGIIVIDFIDMVLESNRDLVLRRLLECLGRDRTKHQVAEVTSLGLVQMTRKRVGHGLIESFSEPCVHCNGRGLIVHMDQPTASGGGGKRRRKAKSGAAVTQREPAEPAEPAEAGEPAEHIATAAEPEPAAAAAPAVAPEPVPQSAAEPEPEPEPKPARTRRRATRKATAPAGPPPAAAEDAAVVVIRAAEPDQSDRSDEADAPAATSAAGAAGAVTAVTPPEQTTPAKKQAAKKTAAKKGAAKKPVKKVTAKKTAKKAAAKTAAKRAPATKAAATTKTAAAPQARPAAVSVPALPAGAEPDD